MSFRKEGRLKALSDKYICQLQIYHRRMSIGNEMIKKWGEKNLNESKDEYNALLSVIKYV